MLDGTTAVAKDLQPEEMADIGQSDAFATCDGVPDKFGRLEVKNYNGWTLTLYPATGKLRAKGSLPTFANGNNLELLTFEQMQCTVPALAAAVGLPATRLEVVHLELSIDLEVSTSPQPFLESLQHHKGSKFCAVAPPKGQARPLQYVAYHADFNAKLYNKNKWAELLGLPVAPGRHKLRCEVVLKRARPINALLNRSSITLADLVTPEFYAAAAAQLEQRWGEIARTQPLDFTGLKRKDRLLLGAGANPEYWRGLRADRAPITYKRERKRYKKLIIDLASRVGPDEYAQRFPLALAALLPPVATTQNDTFFHTFSLLELPSIMRVVKEAAPPLIDVDVAGAGGGGGLLPCPPGHLVADDEWMPTTTAARCCLTCGAPIASHRKSDARYCGKKCRNGASNPRNNAAATRRKIMSQGPLLFDDRAFVRVPEQYRAFVLAAA